jgi:GT2 family glycosyltransferase
MLYTVIIPTYNKIDNLKYCIESIQQYTSLNDIEIIVISNGCKDGTVEYMQKLEGPFKIVHWPEPLGYINSVNIGISLSKGNYIVLLNNDTILNGKGWLSYLIDPFNQISTAGITGPYKGYWNKYPWLMFFCVAIKRDVFKKIGLLDINFHPGYGEDVDFCIRAGKAGFTIHQVPEQRLTQDKNISTLKHGKFPIYHASNTTFKDDPYYSDYLTNSKELLTKKYGLRCSEVS